MGGGEDGKLRDVEVSRDWKSILRNFKELFVYKNCWRKSFYFFGFVRKGEGGRRVVVERENEIIKNY